MMEYLRSYEVSVWTLQDSFITVLKPSNLEHKGQIIDAVLSLKDDGDNRFSLKIPMYVVNDNGIEEENPLWYNTRNGIIVANLRKLKVIFNKKTKEEEVYEFLITKVEEVHDGLTKYCEIECEGLAFNELGKQGFKITLEGDKEISIQQQIWFDTPEKSEYIECPKGNINYWANRVFKGSNWRYSIQMDWSAHDGITHQIYTYPSSGKTIDSDDYINFTEEQKSVFNSWRATNGLRRRDRIYEDSYVTAWKYSEEDNKLIPKTVENEKEKLRPVESQESNRYNLSQTIAEVFGVFCKYKYYYDDNYHIIDREVIFYNNFLLEKEGVIDLTYKYNTDHLVRKMESADLVTKMFVRSLSDKDMPSGETLISYTDANKSLEDYIFNFDYLYNIGTISQEQYDEVEIYEAKMHEINVAYNEASDKLIGLEEEKIEQKARKKTAEDKRDQAIESVQSASSLIEGITGGNSVISIKEESPQRFFLISDSDNTFYCKVRTQGIDIKTLHLYWEYDNTAHTINKNSELNYYSLEKDECGNLIKITNISKAEHDNSALIYGTFDYIPKTHYDNIIKTFSIVRNQNEAIAIDAENKLNEINNSIDFYTTLKETKLKEKEDLINEFERFMGPAIREGQWQPEDEYAGYGELHNENLSLYNNSVFTNDLSSLGWDSELFDGELDCKFYFGIEMKTYYYPCIKITSSMLSGYTIEEFLGKINFVYSNPPDGASAEEKGKQKWKQYMAINSKMMLGFIRNKNSNIVVPVLMILDAQNASETQLQRMLENGHLCKIDTNSFGQIAETDIIQLREEDWLIKPTEMESNDSHNHKKTFEIVYPRIKIKSNIVRSPRTDIYVKREPYALTIYQDFSILPRDSAWFVTLKPHVVLYTKEAFDFNINYSIQYTISTAALAIYLDAVEVLKENAFPKVSYEIDVISVNKDLVYNLYQRLGQIAHINDYEFKFNNVMGYISELNLNLDRPWEDSIVIKNYKTKFEDLFSTIVAQTEQMKKNSAILGLAANAFNSDGTLSSGLVDDMADRIGSTITVNVEVPSPETEYAKYEPYIRSELRQIYTEAGQVLAAAQKSVGDVVQLNSANADILNLFTEDIKENMTPFNFEDDSNGKRYNKDLGKQTLDFKVGDIWSRKDGNVYMATENSYQLYPSGYPDDILTCLDGWSLIQDGSLAQIKGASLNIDAKGGKISLLAENELNIASGGLLKLAGEDVLINGNKTVQIGGPDIKIYSAYKNEPANTTKGIHIYSSVYGATNSTSAVDITGEGVTIGSAGKIDIKADNGINIFSSDGEDTSAIRINRKEGIYLGSSQPIVLYSGTVGSKPTNGYPSGASVEISTNKILFGVSTTGTGTAVEMNPNRIVIGAADTVHANQTEIGKSYSNSNSNTDFNSGVYIDRQNIRLATGTLTNRSYISMNSSGIKIAQATNESYGSVVSVSKSGVIIGVAGSITTDTNLGKRFKNSNSSEDPNNNYNNNKPTFQVYAPNFIVDSGGILYANGANIGGTIRAEAGSIGGWTIGTKKVDNTTHRYITTNANRYTYNQEIAGMTLTADGIGAFNSKNQYFTLSTTGVLTAINATIRGTINATKGVIGASYDLEGKRSGGWNIGTNFIKSFDTSTYLTSQDAGEEMTHAFYTSNGTNEFYVNHDGSLYANSVNVTGSINATSLTIEGQTAKKFVEDNSQKPDLSGYVTKTELYVNDQNGLIEASAFIENKENEQMITGTNLYMDASGNLKLTSIAGNDQIAQIKMVDGVLKLWSGTETDVGVLGSGIQIKKDEIRIVSGGSFTVAGDNFKIDTNGDVSMTGKITATTGGKIGGWNIDGNLLYSGSGDSYMALDGGSGSHRMWCGNETWNLGAFQLLKDGTVICTKGKIGGCDIDENGNLKITSVNISGKLTFDNLPDNVANTDDVTTITNNTIATTNVVAQNLQVKAANISGTLTGHSIKGGNISIGNKFEVDSSGILTAKSAILSDNVSVNKISFSTSEGWSGGSITCNNGQIIIGDSNTNTITLNAVVYFTTLGGHISKMTIKDGDGVSQTVLGVG